MKKKILLIVLLFASYIYSQQKHCIQEIIQKEIYEEYPDLKTEFENAYTELERFTQNFIQEKKASRTTLLNAPSVGYDYIIPTVVHIIHDNGYENLSDATVERAIDILNYFFQGKTAFDNYIDSDFVPIRGAFTDRKLKFVLAKFDPNGIPTNGIDRHRNLTFTMDGSNREMQQTYHWPRENYLNIYITRRSSQSSAGFAYLPSPVASLAYLDGIVMSAWAFGEHTEMWQNWYYVLAHEVGHWLNLYHVWGNAGGGGNNGTSSLYCSIDDAVLDTPNTNGNRLSDLDDYNGAVYNCGSKDNYTNVMDYTSAVRAMFTQGQQERMEATLNSVIAQRNNLWSISNVLETLYGCSPGGLDTDTDNIPNSCDPCPNGQDSDLDGICDNVDLCNGYPDVDVDGNPGVPDACDTDYPIIDFKTKTISSYGTSLDKGVYAIYDNGATFHLSVNSWKSIPFNYTITTNTMLEFDFMSTIDGERHQIGIDSNLEADPLLMFQLYGGLEATSDIVNMDYKTYQDENRFSYKHYVIPIGEFFTGQIKHLVFNAGNDAFLDTWNNGFPYPGGGSYNEATSFFRNVKIYNKNTLSISEIAKDKSYFLYPNPTKDIIKINLPSGILIKEITIYDISGRKIKSKSQQQNTTSFTTSNLSSGTYFIKINDSEQILRFIKQ